MNSSTNDPQTVQVLAQGEWLFRVARRLVRNEADANDVVQETYLAALQSPPPADRPLRGWLGRVAENSVRMKHRSVARRQKRESAAALPEPGDSSFSVLHQKQASAALTQAIENLDEPFRSAIVLRFVDDLTIAEVAAKQGVPVGTAGWRVSEGLKRLRAELETASKGDARPWLMALCPGVEASEPEMATPVAAGGSYLTKVALVLAAVLAMIVLGYVVVVKHVPAAPTVPIEAVPGAVDRSGESSLHAQHQQPGVLPMGSSPSPIGSAGSIHGLTESSADAASARADQAGIIFSIAFSDEDAKHSEELSGAVMPHIGTTLDILSGCYGDFLARKPDLRGISGKVYVDVAFARDASPGGIVVDTTFAAHVGTTTDAIFQECMGESSFALAYDSAPGQLEGGFARIVMEFPDGSPPGVQAQTAARACFDDLHRRRPDLSLSGTIDDQDFARCMDNAVGVGVIGDDQQPEEVRTGVEF